MIPLSYYIILSAIMFSAGLYGIMTKRNAVRILISVEIMLNAANVSILGFNGVFGLNEYEGWAFALIVIAVAAVEAAAGLAIFLTVFRNYHEINASNTISLREKPVEELI